MIDSCPFCHTDLLWERDFVKHKGEHCSVIISNSQSIKGSRYIITNSHIQSPFELTDDEIIEINHFLKLTKAEMDVELKCDGFNIGWNVGEVGGQAVDHVHLHVISRYKNELHAGKGIRHWFKLPENQNR